MRKYDASIILFAVSVAIGLTACSEYRSDTAEVGAELVVPVLTEDERTPVQRTQNVTRQQRYDPEAGARRERESIAAWSRYAAEQEAQFEEYRENYERTAGFPSRAPARSGGKLEDVAAARSQCESDLNNAESSARRYEELFTQGATEGGYHGLSEPNKRSNGQTSINPTTGRAVTVYMGGKLGRAKADEHVSCENALRRRSKYPKAARTCADYKSKIEAAHIAADRARRCIRAARGR